MADSQGEKISIVINGVKCDYYLDPPDTARIKSLTQDGVAAGFDYSVAEQHAISLERAERVKKKKDAVTKSNVDLIQGGPDPASVHNKFNAANGADVGISQRRVAKDQKPQGVRVDDTSVTQRPIITDADQLNGLPTLADKLNKLVYTKSIPGFVDRKIEPLGEGTYFEQLVDMAFQASGSGNANTQAANMFYGIDRFEHSLAMRACDFSGYTFITRPRLNLSEANIAADRKFAAMRTPVPSDVSYYLRCMLDSRFGATHACPLFNRKNPFATLLCNCCTSINGFNDPMLATETTDTGFFQENQTYAIGGDRLANTYDMSLTFRDLTGSPVAAAFDYWYQYMMNIQDGSMVQYADAIDANRMDYTVSIYRFIMDRTRKTITKWAKCTGCFPVNAPVGVPFNKNQGEQFITSADNFSIVFKANRLEYNDPIIIHEFNMLVRRYFNHASGDNDTLMGDNSALYAYGYTAQNNFWGIPYIRNGEHGYELVWLVDQDDKSTFISDPRQPLDGFKYTDGPLQGTSVI